MHAENNESKQHQRLRRLILGEQYSAKLADPRSDDERVAEVLSEAVILRSKQDDSLGEAFSPTLQSALNHSIKQDPQPIIDAIFPIITPALRKAINSAISELVLSLNLLLDKSLSPKSFAWRFQAWRAGKSYAEFILLKTIKYRVEQVMLIDRQTSLVMAIQTAAQIQSQDPEQVSAMLSAISDFISDSFATDGQEHLEEIRVGDFILEIVTSPSAILVAAVRGVSNTRVKHKLAATLEALHSKHQSQLQEFAGRRLENPEIDTLLKECLLEQRVQEDQPVSKPWPLILVLSAGLIMLGYYAFLQYRWSVQSEQIIQTMQAEKGYFLTQHTRSFNHLELTLLRSPLSTPPQKIIQSIEHDLTLNIIQRHAPIGSTQVFLPYIKSRLHLGSAIQFRLQGARLLIQGALTVKQLERILASDFLSRLVADIQIIQTADLQWAASGLRTQDGLPVLYKVQLADPIKQQQQEVKELIWKLNQTHILFASNQVTLDVTTNAQMQQALKLAKRIKALSASAYIEYPDIIIMGFSDRRGDAKLNRRISLERANFVKNWLLDNGIAEQSLMVTSMRNLQQSKLPYNEQRRVAFYATYVPAKGVKINHD